MSKKLKKFKSKTQEEKEELFYWDYPSEPIGGGNPYYRCVSCKVSAPQINGKLENYLSCCEFRIENEMKV